MKERVFAVVPAAGSGRRMGTAVPKQYLDLAGGPVLQHTLERLLAVDAVERIVVALAPGDGRWSRLVFARDPRVHAIPGGVERADSVLAGLHALEDSAADQDWVLVHDAARPCLRPEDVARLLDELKGDPVGGVLALPSVDTLKEVRDGVIERTLDRSRIWRALTPQAFRYRLLRDALEGALAAGKQVTDEASAVEQAGFHPCVVTGHPDNIKITRLEDLPLAEWYLGRAEVGLRIGQGYDVHCFGAGDHVVLGGVRIPFTRGLAAHSDGDVALHALCDALLGAAGLGDIGRHFPDTAAEFSGIDSRVLLRRVRELLAQRRLVVVNADLTIVCQAPRLASHIPAMVGNIAADLGVVPERVNVKATTTEGMGFEGRGEGISAQAVVLLGLRE